MRAHRVVEHIKAVPGATAADVVNNAAISKPSRG